MESKGYFKGYLSSLEKEKEIFQDMLQKRRKKQDPKAYQWSKTISKSIQEITKGVSERRMESTSKRVKVALESTK